MRWRPAPSSLPAGTHKKVLVIGADVMTSIIDFQDRATCVLFGDGAGAVLLEPAEEGEQGIIDFILRSDGDGGQFPLHAGRRKPESLDRRNRQKTMHYVHQDGKNVFKFAVRGMADVSQEILDRHKLTARDLKLYIPHQANLRIIRRPWKGWGSASRRSPSISTGTPIPPPAPSPSACLKPLKLKGLWRKISCCWQVLGPVSPGEACCSAGKFRGPAKKSVFSGLSYLSIG